jgi:hypothetical protein
LKLVLWFAGATGGSEGVESHAGNFTAFALSVLFKKQEATFAVIAESVGRVASPGYSVL